MERIFFLTVYLSKQGNDVFTKQKSYYFIDKTEKNCSTTGKPTRSFATERVSLDSV